MRYAFVAVLALAAMAALSVGNRQAGAPPATPAPGAEVVADVPEPAALPAEFSPSRFLFDIGSTEPELIQMGGTLPRGWRPEPPLDLSGAMPADDEVRAAIVRGVEYLLDQQAENGSWDVELRGTMLSQTADHAVDAIAATSLVGVALRYHVKVDPNRIEPALKRAADFVMDRIYRGRLSTRVYYANWRYTLGLKFLHMEFMATQDTARREEFQSVCRRMVQAMMKMQLSNSEAPLLERKRKARISARKRDTAMPAQLGVVLDPPTDQTYRGGAPVIRIVPGSAAEKGGLQVGDRIVAAEHQRVENAVDYYLMEAGWVSGQKVNLRVAREGGRDFARDFTLPQSWPGYLGLKVNAGIGLGPTVEAMLRFSPAKGTLEVGDVITKIDGKPIGTLEEYRAFENTVEPGKRVRFEVQREGKRKSGTVSAVAAPEGWYGFSVKEEDKGDGDGVVLGGRTLPGSSAETLGLKSDDRVTWIGDTPILGLDHFIDFVATVPAGKTVTIKWERGGVEMSGEATADAVVMPGDPQFGFKRTRWGLLGEPVINQPKAGGVSQRAGVRDGDVIIGINGQEVDSLWSCILMLMEVAAGDEITLKLRRSTNEFEVKFVLAKYPETDEDEVEEGGWAYYPDMGESPSFSTASALLAMYDVQRDILPNSVGRLMRPSLKSAENLLSSLRVNDPTNGGQETYIYRGGSREGGNNSLDIRGCQGRNAICELALMMAKRRRSTDVKRAIDNFIKYRGELDAVRTMEFYNPPNKGGSPHNFDRYWNAAYYWMYGHYHTLLAARHLGTNSKSFKDMNQICVKAIMKTRHADGTWLDHPSFGKLCGTALALWVLGETDGAFRDGYDVGRTTQDRRTDPEPEEDEDLE